jgi:hypothetical protein
MTNHCCCGQVAYDVGRGVPVWEPLLDVVGERLAETFMRANKRDHTGLPIYDDR